MAVLLLVCFVTLTSGSMATLLYNGLQSQVLTANITTACDAAFNTTLNCPENVVQFITYPMQSIGWNTSTLQSLCTPDCETSLADLYSEVDSNCGQGMLTMDNQNLTFSELVDHIQYKFGLICLRDGSTNDFCSDVESTWNITEMVLDDSATWPTHTNKCYIDVSIGSWSYSTDFNGTCTEPFTFSWDNATDTQLSQMAALDYYVDRPDPIDDDNYGWYEPLEFDEYPLEIQCSSCFLSKFKYGLENSWGDMWDEVTEQVWANIQLNCGLSETITPANNFSGVGVVVDQDLPDVGSLTTICPQTLYINGSSSLSCQEVAVQFKVPIAGLRNLNNNLFCGGMSNRTLCASLSCDIAIVDLGTVGVLNDTLNIPNYVARYTNFTLTQFYTWNPYIGQDYVRQGDTVCVGPPGGVYLPPSATVAVPTVYTTTAIAESPTPSGTVPNCGLYYLVESGDNCDLVSEKYGLTFSELIDLNPSINSACSNLIAGEDYCVAAVNGTFVSSATTTLAPSSSTSSTSTTSSKTSSSASATTTYPAPPSPTVSGTTPYCNVWYTVGSGDDCSTIEAKYGITLQQFIALNTFIDSSCNNLYLDYSYCVSGIPLSSSSSTTASSVATTTSSAVATPTPTQSGMVSGCKVFYEAQPNDGCYDIAQEYGITLDNFYAWNPAVGNDCSGLWPDYYYCVGM